MLFMVSTYLTDRILFPDHYFQGILGTTYFLKQRNFTEPVPLFHLQQIIVNMSDFNKAWNYTPAQQINKQQQGQLLYFLVSSVQIYLFIFLSIPPIKKKST